MIAWLKRRLLRWLANELRVLARAQRGFDKCISEDDAVFHDEAEIVNIKGEREAIRIGAGSHVRAELLTYGHGGAIHVGRHCYLGRGTRLWSMAGITLGDRVVISHDVNIHDGNGHANNARLRHEHMLAIFTVGHPRDAAALPGVAGKPIFIEDDVLIQFNAIVLRGVRIGARSIVAAGAVVVHDVPSDVVVAGCPARIVKQLGAA